MGGRTGVLVGVLLGLALLAGACGDGGSDNPAPPAAITLPGVWSGSWVLHDGVGGPDIDTGTMTMTFTVSTGNVGGTLTSTSANDICVIGGVTASVISGALAADLTFFYNPTGTSKVDFTADFPADPINGFYDVTFATGSERCNAGWGGTFRLNKQ